MKRNNKTPSLLNVPADRHLKELRTRINKKFGLKSLGYMIFFDTYIRNKSRIKVKVKVVCDDNFYVFINNEPPKLLYKWASEKENYDDKVEAKVKSRLFDVLKNL